MRDSKIFPVSKWWFLSWLLHKQKIEISDTKLILENLADVSIECFSLHQMMTEPFS